MERAPWRFEFGDEFGAVDVAWTLVSRLPTAAYLKIRGLDYTEFETSSSERTMEDGGLFPYFAGAIVEHLQSINPDQGLLDFKERIKRKHLAHGMDEELADYATNILILGICVGRREAEIIEDYSRRQFGDKPPEDGSFQ